MYCQRCFCQVISFIRLLIIRGVLARLRFRVTWGLVREGLPFVAQVTDKNQSGNFRPLASASSGIEWKRRSMSRHIDEIELSELSTWNCLIHHTNTGITRKRKIKQVIYRGNR